ncbi:hypothetical protein FB45DRAFT_947461 [Roridomyces roridus]|uniref:C2H2-type domain-containing protein n=1 Tax=Roridomyces roridus TaxID=1738132 RepID=A0AAD7B2N0_9AGAR|nr:hypothetical protein FB45DRAFT_947461 [Roridomyces roridus]
MYPTTLVKDLVSHFQKTYDCGHCGLSFTDGDDLRWHRRQKECDDDDVDNFQRRRQVVSQDVGRSGTFVDARPRRASNSSDDSTLSDSLHRLIPSPERVDAVVSKIRGWAPTSDDSDAEHHSIFPTHASARIGAVVDKIRHHGASEPIPPALKRKYPVGTHHRVPPPFSPSASSSKAAPPLPPRPQSQSNVRPAATSSIRAPPPLPPRPQADVVVGRPRASTTPSRRAAPPIPVRAHGDVAAVGRPRASTTPCRVAPPLPPRPTSGLPCC